MLEDEETSDAFYGDSSVFVSCDESVRKNY